jgi:hypothetical protein
MLLVHQDFKNLDIGYRWKLLSDIGISDKFLASQSDIGHSDRGCLISLITDIGLSAHLFLRKSFFVKIWYKFSRGRSRMWRSWIFICNTDSRKCPEPTNSIISAPMKFSWQGPIKALLLLWILIFKNVRILTHKCVALTFFVEIW